jgi:hypothetical protein
MCEIFFRLRFILPKLINICFFLNIKRQNANLFYKHVNIFKFMRLWRTYLCIVTN